MSDKLKSSRSKEKNVSSLNKIVIGSVTGTMLFFCIVSLFAYLSLKTEAFSSSLYMPMGLVSGALSAFSGGFIAVRPIRKKGAAFGALTGFAQALICSAAAFFINGNKVGSGLFILMAVITVLGSAGGISAVNLKAGKRY